MIFSSAVKILAEIIRSSCKCFSLDKQTAEMYAQI
jgi:hypothetical protein